MLSELTARSPSVMAAAVVEVEATSRGPASLDVLSREVLKVRMAAVLLATCGVQAVPGSAEGWVQAVPGSAEGWCWQVTGDRQARMAGTDQVGFKLSEPQSLGQSCSVLQARHCMGGF